MVNKNLTYEMSISLCSTSLRSNIRPDINNLIVEISWYDKGGLVANGYSNVLMELRCVIRFIN